MKNFKQHLTELGTRRVGNRNFPKDAAHDWKNFNDPWAVMSPEDRKEMNRLFSVRMKSMPGSPRQRQAAEKMNALMIKYKIGSSVKEAASPRQSTQRRSQLAKTEIAKQVPVATETHLNALCVAASKKYPNDYILAYVDFSLATIFKTNKLPTNAYASDDWKAGYWKDGKRFKWSEARIAAAQRAVDKLSGLQ